VWNDRSPYRARKNLLDDFCSNGDTCLDRYRSCLWIRCYGPVGGARKNPHLRHLVKLRGKQWMFGWSVGDAKIGLVVSMVIGLLVVVATGRVLSVSLRSSAPEATRDYEECVEALPAASSLQQPSLNDAQRSSITDCNARFAGRRKPGGGGGYIYYDFMQDRSFDIAGPNPTAEERNRIDREYMGFLDIQQRERASEDLAKKRDEELRADLERARQPVGRPLILTPKTAPAQASKRSPDRAKSPRCEDNSLACGWSKLSAAVKDALASSTRPKP
jgi:hypothetical protein